MCRRSARVRDGDVRSPRSGVASRADPAKRHQPTAQGIGYRPGGIVAVLVTRSFYVSHQCLRELKRRGGGVISGVYFRLYDQEPVWVGHYGRAHRLMTPAQAVAEFHAAEDRRGWEVIVPRRVSPKEIHRVLLLPQVVGWRFFPGAKGKPPPCTCKYCTRGDYGARGLRARLGAPDA